MESINENKTAVIPQWEGIFGSVRRRLTSRSGLTAVAILAISAGAVFKWSALVAAGIAPLILAVLPCAAMCALGLCANRLTPGGSCSNASPNSPNSEASIETGNKSKGAGNS